MNRLIWVLLVMLALARQSFQYSCKDQDHCACIIIRSESTYRMECPKDNSFQLIVTVEEKRKASVKCHRMAPWSDLTMNSTTDVEDVDIFSIEHCPLPDTNLYEIAQRIGVRPIGTLIFESLMNLSSTLKRDHLSGFPKIKRLMLTDNGLTELPDDLLMDFPELTTLLLGNNNVVLPLKFFDNVPELRWLDLARNQLTNIDPMLLGSLKNLTYLGLRGNNLTHLEKDTFLGLDKLTTLDISKNKFRTLEPEVFQAIGNLSKLYISENNFYSLPENLLTKNLNLTDFYLNYNYGNLSTLPSRFLANLPKLNNTELKLLRLKVLPEDIFWGSSSITTLNLARNLLTTLPKNIFNESNNLQKLDLSYNKISNLPDGVFQGLEKLTKLELQENELTSISGELFMGLSGLIELNLEKNGLRTITPKSFTYMKALQIARLSYNQLDMAENSDLDIGPISSISGCERLNELYLAYNNINTIFFDWITSTSLRKIDLNHNKLSYLSADDLQFVSNDIVVDIRHNNISRIDLRNAELIAVQNLSNSRIVRIFIEENPVICDCNLYDFIRYLDGDMHPNVQKMFHIIPGGLKCYGPDFMQHISISDIKFKTFQCLINPCPENCTCSFRKYDSAVIANCSYKNLRTAPQRIISGKHSKVELDLTGNFLTEVPFVNQSGLGNITKLLLSHNQISRISPDNVPPMIEVLELHNNNLTKIDSLILERFQNSTSLKNVTLHKNPWQCDCESKDLLSFIQSKFKKIPNLLNVTCENNAKPISTMTLNNLCPLNIGMIIGSSFGIALIGLVIGIMAALYYRYQSEIKVWLYANQMCLRFVTEEELDKDKLFDAFISYSHKDEDFVVNKLLPMLEEGPKPFKLCLHFRDWVAGEWIPTQIARSVEDSRRTIVILSPNFLESIWGRMEFRAAHSQALSEGRARVIVILYGDVGPTDQLDPELKAYLSMNTYVQWGDPLFWDKLRYALPHSPRVAQKNAQRIYETHPHHIQINGDKNGLIYPSGVPPTPPAASTPPADSLKTFTSNGSIDKGVLITDCLKNGMTNFNNPNVYDVENTGNKREWENNIINRECTPM